MQPPVMTTRPDHGPTIRVIRPFAPFVTQFPLNYPHNSPRPSLHHKLLTVPLRALRAFVFTHTPLRSHRPNSSFVIGHLPFPSPTLCYNSPIVPARHTPKGTHTMKLGLQVPIYTWPDAPQSIAPTFADIARTAEQAGFYSLWVMDHFFQLEGMLGPRTDPMLEGYTTLGYAAGLTQTIKLGLMVTGNIYRYPGMLIKTVTTLDVLSSGRAYLGIGAGWYEQESLALGLPFPSTKIRFEWLEETLQIAHKMWSDDNTPYQGQHFQLAEPYSSPMPLSQPHPPILIGGTGEQKTLRMVAQYADACNIFMDPTPANRAGALAYLDQKLAVLKDHCTRLERDYDTIEKTTLSTIDLDTLSTTDIIDYFTALREHGITHAIINMPNAHETHRLRTIGEHILPALANL